jgi:hypothetical protein
MAITRPTTKTVISTTQWGVPITDEVNRLSPIVDGRTPTAWTAPTLLNGWTNYSGYVTQYRKIGDVVQIRGGVQGGTLGANIFVLPSGYRPPSQTQFPVSSYSVVGIITIDGSGNVYPNTPSDTRFVGLAVSFSTIA